MPDDDRVGVVAASLGADPSAGFGVDATGVVPDGGGVPDSGDVVPGSGGVMPDSVALDDVVLDDGSRRWWSR